MDSPGALGQMKIALVRMRYVPYGGAENYLALVGKELLRLGHEIHIFSSRWDSNGRSFILHKVPVIRGLSFLRALSFAVNSAILLKKERFGIIISFDRILYQDIYRAGDGCHREWLEQKKRVESPFQSFLTKINPFHVVILYLEKRIYQGSGCSRIIANSFKGKEDIIRHYNTPEDKITVIYNGADSDRFKPSNRDAYRERLRKSYGINDSDIVILFVGSGFRRKGLEYLLKGVSRLRTQDSPNSLCETGQAKLKILVVGKGDYDYYEKMAEKLEIGQDIIFAGTTERVEEFYASSDIFILPTIYDPFSNACLEAMASGLPVITTKDNGASEIIEDGRDGFILDDPSDPVEMSSKIKLLMDGDFRETVGKEARKKAEIFTIEQSVRKMVEICG